MISDLVLVYWVQAFLYIPDTEERVTINAKLEKTYI